MKFFEVIIELFAFYVLYKLIFDFIIPIVNTTKHVKKQFGDMQEKMNQFNQQQDSGKAANVKTSSTTKAADEDYIEYEEVK